MYRDIDVEIVDFLDLVDETLSNKFVNRWRFRFSEKFLKQFQLKVLSSLSKQKPLKLKSLFNYLTRKCNYSPEQVINFLDSIDINLYRPLIQGNMRDIALPIESERVSSPSRPTSS